MQALRSAAVVVMLAVLIGCGGESMGTSPPPPPGETVTSSPTAVGLTAVPGPESAVSEDPAVTDARMAAWLEEWNQGMPENRELACAFYVADPESSWESYQTSSEEMVPKSFFMDFYNSVC